MTILFSICCLFYALDIYSCKAGLLSEQFWLDNIYDITSDLYSYCQLESVLGRPKSNTLTTEPVQLSILNA